MKQKLLILFTNSIKPPSLENDRLNERPREERSMQLVRRTSGTLSGAAAVAAAADEQLIKECIYSG